MKTREIWKRLPEDEDYLISNHGRIWSFKIDKRNGKEVKPYFANGFAFFRINARTNPKSLNITYIVAKLFVPNEKPNDYTRVIHIDENTKNNYYKNLRWTTDEHANAISHKKRKITVGRTRKSFITHSKLTHDNVAHIKSLLLRNIPLRKIAMLYNISDMQVHRIKVGENWKDVKPAKHW